MSPVWLQKHYGFAPAITLQANSIATIMLCIGCLLAGLAADRFGASRTFIVGSLLGGLQLGVLSPFRQQSRAAVPAVWHGGIVRWGCGRRALRHGARFPAEVRFTGISFSYNVSYAILAA